jgi:hypothetical protein
VCHILLSAVPPNFKRYQPAMADEPVKNFGFVLIPADSSLELSFIERSSAGGLEKDELQVYAKAHFASEKDASLKMEAAMQVMREQGQDIQSLNPQILEHLSSLGASVEIITVGVASAVNGYEAVSLYCDGDGSSKGLSSNSRAIEIARACGHNSLAIYGDAFLSRCYDNEEEPWVRRTLTLDEASTSAPWVLKAAAANAGRNMKAYSSSGSSTNAIQAMLKQQRQDPTISSPAVGTEGPLTWTQTDDEVDFIS